MDDGRLREERLDGEVVYDGRIVRLEVDHVRLANGHETVREVIRHSGAVVVLPLHADGSVTLVRQFRYPVGRVLLELPAGKLDRPGEEPLECARRELAEETGLKASSWRRLGSFYTTPGFTDEIIHAFAAEGVERDASATPEDDEVLEPVTLAMDELEAMAAHGEILDAKTLATLALWRSAQARGRRGQDVKSKE